MFMGMFVGFILLVVGMMFAFWQITRFNLYGMFFGYVVAGAGLIIFLDRVWLSF